MMRSMFSGVSGLRVHQTKMDVIANNISNVNTVGFKSSRVTFNEIFAQTLASASGPNAQTERGGTNPMQIGLGANVASIDLLMTQGAAQRTDNPYDIMIQGEGFFVVSDSSGTYYARAGAFRIDENGNLTMPNGMLINGYDINPDRTNPGQFLVDKNNVSGIRIAGDKVSSDPERTTAIVLEGNMNADEDGTDGIKTTMGFFDSLGNKFTLDVLYKYDRTAKNWTAQFGNYMYMNGDEKNGIYIGDVTTAMQPVVTPPAVADNTLGAIPGLATITTKANTTPPADFAWGTVSAMRLSFTDGGYVNANPTAVAGPPAVAAGTLTGFTMNITDPVGAIVPVSSFADIKVNLRELNQFNLPTDVLAVEQDGAKAGTLTEIGIQPDGTVVGRYTNGKTKDLAKVVLAQFRNPAGLQKYGNNLYQSTNNSGNPNVGEAAEAGASLLGGVLEMANVDLSSEFTEMITTQRGFQANSRIITTSDDMLQELVNLKR